MKYTTFTVLLLAGFAWPAAQANSHQSNYHKGQVTVQGCVARSGGDYILTESDPSNSYVLHSGKKLKLGRYLGQQVEVAGIQSATLSDSSDAARSVPATMITASSIRTISNECRP